MANKTLMADISSNNGLPADQHALTARLREHWNNGYRVLGVKCSEGTAYTWDLSHAVCRIWHSFGGLILHYHFLTPGQGGAQADYFWTHVAGDVEPYDRLVADAETKGETGQELAAFISRSSALSQRRVRDPGLIYGSPYFLRDNTIRPVNGWGLWLADYAPKVALIPPGWQDWTAWQYTSGANATGIGAGTDLSRLKPALLQPTLRYGDACFAVLDLKQRLNTHGYARFRLVMNNRFGAGTRLAVNALKKAHNKAHPHDPWSLDGIAGGRVWKALGG